MDSTWNSNIPNNNQQQNQQTTWMPQQNQQAQNNQTGWMPQQQPSQQAASQQQFQQNWQNNAPINAAAIQKQKKERAGIYQILALPTLLYALLYTIFLYENFSSITMPFFVLTTIGYVFYCMEKLGIKRKKDTYLYAGIMMLLGVSDAITGNEFIIFFNNAGIILVLICMLLHNYFEDRKWTFGKYFAAIFTAVFGAVGSIGDPFSDAASYHTQKCSEKNKKALYILAGIGISIPLLVVVVSLLCSADAVFASILRESFQFHFNFGNIFGVIFMYVFALFSAYCGLRYLGKRRICEECKAKKNWEPMIAITVLSLISIVYLFFSMIQIVYLFIGNMELPDGYTYAAYAREGFFQLLFICMLNVFLVLFVLHSFRDNAYVKALLFVISGCTYVMIASSAFRMILYIQNYHLTLLRILVLWALAVMAVLLAGILIQIVKKDFPLFRYGLVVVCAGYLILSFSHPDYFIASYNLKQIEAGNGEADYFYLQNLSSDAAPAFTGCEGEWVKNYAKHLSYTTDDEFRKYNVSRAYARNKFAKQIRDYEAISMEELYW